MKKIEFFKIEGDKINRIRRHCPKCGAGVFLAEHKDRLSCGKCGYTEFKSAGKKEPTPLKVDEKPIKKPAQEEKPSEEQATTVPSVDEPVAEPEFNSEKKQVDSEPTPIEEKPEEKKE